MPHAAVTVAATPVVIVVVVVVVGIIIFEGRGCILIFSSITAGWGRGFWMPGQGGIIDGMAILAMG